MLRKHVVEEGLVFIDDAIVAKTFDGLDIVGIQIRTKARLVCEIYTAGTDTREGKGMPGVINQELSATGDVHVVFEKETEDTLRISRR